MKSTVVITDAPKINYMHNYVSLPYYYGTDRYFSRPDVKAIRETVYASLETLDRSTGFAERFRGKTVLVKPNLVFMMHNSGYALDDIPQSTDPRVFEAVISYLAGLKCTITIVESSGKGAPTMQHFQECGIDRIAKFYGTGLVALEEQPLDHYLVPKAEVQKDVYIPRIVSEIIEGKALYVSVPKMKTNLYTGVTLGFKNAMGMLPGYMRYRNHNYNIEAKLVDMLYLFKPDLTVVDGIIGGEGNTPGPVDPVKVGMIVTGTNSVEVDRVVTRIMGFDPENLALMKEAEKRGFGDPEVEIIGTERVVPFRPAESSFLTPRFRRNWPNVRYFVGFTNDRAPKIKDIHAVTPEMVYEMEGACRGGCLATMSFYMEMLKKARKRPNPKRIAFAAVLGNGVEADGKRYWFDADGNPYDLEALKKTPVKHMIGCGACTSPAYGACDIKGGGCCNVSEFLSMFMRGSGAFPPMFSIENDMLPAMGIDLLRKYFARRKLVKSGELYDIPYDAVDDRIFAIPELSGADADRDWIRVPMPKLSKTEIRAALKATKLLELK